MKFRQPLFLLAMLPVVALVVRAYVDMIRGRFSGHVAIPWRRLWGFHEEDTTNAIPPRFWPVLFYAISAALFVLALARPQMSYQKVKRNVEGIDIMIVLDLSASMRIEDFRDQNRIDTAKQILRGFIEGRPNDRIGFQGFSGEAVTLVPPTLDHTLVLQALKNIDIGDLKDGTAIGDALATGVARLKESTNKSKILVLVTDGDSNVGSVDPLTGGELAKGYGIRVYSVAIGRDGRVAMPFVQKDVFGRQVKTYQYFDSSINPELLRQISSVTGGKFYRVQDDVKIFHDVFTDIDQLERSKIETTEQVKYEERFMKFVMFGIFAFVVAFTLQHAVMRVYP
ncbi:MAG: VWA domain-containing protein [Deltaproteobacteria bacterium]|nr:VWA domain-containing protein [Deltaproteobacteria bacterium]